MKLHLHDHTSQNLITGVSSTGISVNHQTYDSALLVSAQQLRPKWFEGRLSDLSSEHLLEIKEWSAEVVLLGTGDKHRFVHPKQLQQLLNSGIAVECMTTAAACRTYNILLAEGRQVVAALMLEQQINAA